MPAIPYRELYGPAHSGNSCEVVWPRQMRDILSEARHRRHVLSSRPVRRVGTTRS